MNDEKQEKRINDEVKEEEKNLNTNKQELTKRNIIDITVISIVAIVISLFVIFFCYLYK